MTDGGLVPSWGCCVALQSRVAQLSMMMRIFFDSELTSYDLRNETFTMSTGTRLSRC